VAYFSRSGKTRKTANKIHESVGGNIFEIVIVDPYPNGYDEVVKQAKQELEEGYGPELESKVENMESYDVVFIQLSYLVGYNAHAGCNVFVEIRFFRKTIVPFCTHEGSHLGRTVTDITKLCPQSTILDGLAVRGRDVKNGQNEVSEWLHEGLFYR